MFNDPKLLSPPRRRAARHACWLCALWALAMGLCALALTARAEPVKVVTAPWAAPSQAAGYNGPPLLAQEPPPLLTTPPPPPLTPAERQILKDTIKSEPLPEPTWLRYVVSNEWRHDVIFPKVAGLGGAYIGVATDQNYTVAAAARSELLFLFDYDAEIGRIHRIYRALIAQVEDPSELRALFEPANAARARQLIATGSTDDSPKEIAALQKVYDHYRDRLRIYLRAVANIQVGGRHPTWLGDPAAYAYLRALVKGGRVVTVQGDMHGTTALRSIGAACRALKIPVRIFYTSNAEAFFKYSPAFRDNLASFPSDDRSVMLRTYKHGLPAAAGDTWHYNLHQIKDFQERLALRDYGTIGRVMADLRAAKKAADPLGFSYMDTSIPRHGDAPDKQDKPAAPAAAAPAVPAASAPAPDKAPRGPFPPLRPDAGVPTAR